ncbi:class I SAM-dependent methyltransferase [Prosthecobacter sp. SYSU 5D2]|uniref:class I SAM-dependent methyltransferase n=1 Tax=Prosthecobacter sp. SYSU 5D2 TaxID=3134134 RepID=UPI0031FE9969
MPAESTEMTSSLQGLVGENLSIIVCRNSQGAEVRGTVHRLSRHLAVFEVYNPYSILQLSEVLTDFRVTVNDRMLYSGRAVITNLVNTGIMLILEASLEEDDWLDQDMFAPLQNREGLGRELAEMLQDTNRIFRVYPQFKIIVIDIQTVLTDLKRWLEQVELCVRSLPSGDRHESEIYAIQEVEKLVLPALWPLFLKFEEAAAEVPQELIPIHRGYIKRQLHPIVLCSPFTYRTYQKPLGYAGDYEMVSMMLRSPYEGSTVFAKLINRVFLESPTVIAHRNRITYLNQMLHDETARVQALGRRIRLFNLGCGPAQEVQRFMTGDELSNEADFTLVDFNDETLEHTQQTLTGLSLAHNRRTGLEFVKKSVHQILKEGVRPGTGTYDVVYCAGLFDYLSDRVCRRLLEIFHEMVAPGGLLIATNVHSRNPSRHWMECVMDWHLVYRTDENFLALTPSRAAPGSTLIKAEETGVNIFMEIRKPMHV